MTSVVPCSWQQAQRALVALAIAALVATVTLAGATSEAQAVGNLTGNWNISFTGPPLNAACSAAVTHGGGTLVIDGPCTPTLTGTIDKQSGAVWVGWSGSTGTLGVLATATDTTMTGTWFAIVQPGGAQFQGPFSGTRTSTAPAPVGGIAELPGVATGAPPASGAGGDLIIGVAAGAATAVLACGAVLARQRASARR
jgi:hypothetical protein